MRILIVSQYFWPENFRINDLAFALKEKGHEVTVLTGMPNYPAGKIYEGYTWWSKRRDDMAGISIVRVPLFARRESKGWQLAINYLSYAVSGCVFGSWMLSKKPIDVVFTVNYSPVTVGIPAILMSWLKKAPMVFWVQDLWPQSLSATGAVRSPKLLAMVGNLVSWIYRHCDYLLLQSKGFEKPVLELGADTKQCYYFPNWAESLYKPVELPKAAKERTEIPSDGFVVMFAGNLGAAQSLEIILDAADSLKNESIYWVFLGDGRRKEWLVGEAKKRGLSRIMILGHRPMDTMPAYFSLADTMLVTLRDDAVMATTIPGKVQSYLACGKPIVGALNGSGKEVIQQSNAGYCVSSGDSKGFSAAIKVMVNLEKKELEEMGKAARAYYLENFDRDFLVQQLEDWLQESIK